MAVMVTSTRETTRTAGADSPVKRDATKNGRTFNGSSRGPRGRGPEGGGGDGYNLPGDGWTPDRYRIGMWVALASIMMLFTALTSAYIVRAGISNDWRPIGVPPFVWVSTALLFGSSVTMTLAKRTLHRQGNVGRFRGLLFATLLLGLGFVGAQLLAWRELVAAGVYISTNPHSSFFYVLTGLHGLHIAGGILGLNYLLFRVSRREASEGDAARIAAVKQRAATDVVALYWHFMDLLWIFLFLLLFVWR